MHSFCYSDSEVMNMSMGKRICQARKKKGYTQEYVAAVLCVSRQAVYKWEKDLTKPDADNLLALSDLLSVSTDYLIKGNQVNGQKPESYSGEVFFRVSLIPLLLLPVCWIIGVFSGAYTQMVQLPLSDGLRVGLPFLMYGHSPAAIILVIVSIVCLILFVLLIALGANTNQK